MIYWLLDTAVRSDIDLEFAKALGHTAHDNDTKKIVRLLNSC